MFAVNISIFWLKNNTERITRTYKKKIFFWPIHQNLFSLGRTGKTSNILFLALITKQELYLFHIKEDFH